MNGPRKDRFSLTFKIISELCNLAFDLMWFIKHEKGRTCIGLRGGLTEAYEKEATCLFSHKVFEINRSNYRNRTTRYRYKLYKKEWNPEEEIFQYEGRPNPVNLWN